jgi:hypothetical protein
MTGRFQVAVAGLKGPTTLSDNCQTVDIDTFVRR